MNYHILYILCLSLTVLISLIVMRYVYKDSVISFIGISISAFSAFASVCTYVFSTFGWWHVFWTSPVIIASFIFLLRYAHSTVRQPLNHVVDIATDLSDGRLKTYKSITKKGEIGKIVSTLTDTINNLREIIINVINSADEVASASEEIAKGSNDLSLRTEQQVSFIRETKDVMNEINGSIKLNTGMAEQANKLAKVTDSKAGHGKEAVQYVINSMDEISESSKKIGDIINVMNEISFQTNILALNAAVEAARAGEHGRGFAIVAAEVRRLAQKSASASKEIASHVLTSNEKVDNGIKSVKQAEAALAEITEVVENVNTLMVEITTANNEQINSIEDINEAIIQINNNILSNATLVEESASAAEELSAQAYQLNNSMSYFNINK